MIRTTHEIEALTPGEAWERYIGADSTRLYTVEDLARYVAEAPLCEGLDAEARDALREKLAACLEAGAVDVQDVMNRLVFEVDAHKLDLVEGYAWATVTVELDGNELCKARVFWSVGWLERGAHADLDGSGLALWGSSQPGGWRTTERGAGEDGRDGRRGLVDAIREELERRGLLLDEPDLDLAVTREVDGWDLGTPEAPSALDIWQALEGRRSTDADQWRVGSLCGRRTPILAWVDEEGEHAFTWSPDEHDIDQAARCARARIKRALEALEEVER